MQTITYKNPGSGRPVGARRLPFRLSRIVNRLTCDRFALAKYPFRMAGRYSTSFLTRMDNNKQVQQIEKSGFPKLVDWNGQLAWIRANRLPHPENK